VALDLAAAAIRDGRCNAAFVVGVNVLSSARSLLLLLRQANFLSPSDKCVPFGGDGYARSEGCGCVLLGRPAEAEQRALVLATAVHQDGRSVTLYAPSEPRVADGAA
jgi:acyl transferase domain-containing protein